MFDLRRRQRTLPTVPGMLFEVLSGIEKAIVGRAHVHGILEVLEASRRPMYDCLDRHFQSPIVAKAVTLKILNLCLAKYHFLERSATLLSRPFGLNIDPANACNLACPGCVHSHTVKERQLFIWNKNMLPENRLAAFLARYGPYAIHVVFCNYGEPLINAETPRYIRVAKSFLMQAMISTSMSIGRFDAEAYVESGLDYMLVSIDGATQPVYETFRKNGNLDLVFRNVRKLVEAKRKLGKRTPVIAWRFLAFRHNVHEVPLAIRTARDLGVDQFLTHTPYDVSWDDPAIQPGAIEPVNVHFNQQTEACVLENWNPFPGSLEAGAIEREFEMPWPDRPVGSPDGGVPQSGSTCHWLYKSITLDAGGRIFPCCAPPRPDIDLHFADLDGAAGEPYNTDKYRLARQFFGDPEGYRRERESGVLSRDPHCVNCEWKKDGTNTDGRQVRQYLKAAGGGLFNPGSADILASW
ncbi:MAG TPA: radical SAM protein [Bryobacteraceae bacterium]|nr:radical SAM protein [Bryobacteraceae bacterium]